MHRLLPLVPLLLASCATPPPPVEASPPVASPAPPPPAPPAPEVQVPPGCMLNLRGEWMSADRERRYVVEDDGTTVVIRQTGAPDHEALTLRRTAEGFSGEVRSVQPNARGRPCPVSFRALVAACQPTSLVLHVERPYLVDEHCRRLPGDEEPQEHRLLRR